MIDSIWYLSYGLGWWPSLRLKCIARIVKREERSGRSFWTRCWRESWELAILLIISPKERSPPLSFPSQVFCQVRKWLFSLMPYSLFPGLVGTWTLRLRNRREGWTRGRKQWNSVPGGPGRWLILPRPPPPVLPELILNGYLVTLFSYRVWPSAALQRKLSVQLGRAISFFKTEVGVISGLGD